MGVEGGKGGGSRVSNFFGNREGEGGGCRLFLFLGKKRKGKRKSQRGGREVNWGADNRKLSLPPSFYFYGKLNGAKIPFPLLEKRVCVLRWRVKEGGEGEKEQLPGRQMFPLFPWILSDVYIRTYLFPPEVSWAECRMPENLPANEGGDLRRRKCLNLFSFPATRRLSCEILCCLFLRNIEKFVGRVSTVAQKLRQQRSEKREERA